MAKIKGELAGIGDDATNGNDNAPGIVDAGNGSGDIAGLPLASLPNVAGFAVGSDDTIKRGRGRPAGSGNGNRKPSTKREKATPSSVKGIEKILFSIHAMAAAGFNTEELAIDESEAALLSEAITEVSSHYNTVIDPKVVAWVGLIGVCGKIYAPRIATIKMRKAMEKSSAPAE